MDAVQLLRKQIAERTQKVSGTGATQDSNAIPPSSTPPPNTPSNTNKLEELRKQIAERNKAATTPAPATTPATATTPVTTTPATLVIQDQRTSDSVASSSVVTQQEETSITKLPFIEITGPEMAPVSPRSPRLSSNQIAMSLELKDRLVKKSVKDNDTKLAVDQPPSPRIVTQPTLPMDKTVVTVVEAPHKEMVEEMNITRSSRDSDQHSAKTGSSVASNDDSRLSMLQEQIKELHTTLAQNVKEKVKLEEENAQLSREVTLVKRDNSTLNDQIRQLKSDLNSKIAELDHHTIHSQIDLSNVHSPDVQDLLVKLEERNKERLQYKELLKELQVNLDKKTKERSELKEQIKQEQDRVELEAKRRGKVEEYSKELERKLEIEMKKRIELEKEIERGNKTEDSLKKELEKARKRIYEDIDQDSSVDVYNKQLEMDLEKMRRRIESISTERDNAETDKYKIQQEVEELKELLTKAARDRDRAIADNQDLNEEVVQLQRRLQAESKERREAEQIKNALLEYKLKFNKEWEEKIALESKLSSQERDLIGFKRKLEMEIKSRKTAEDTIEALERTVASLKEADRDRTVADTDRKKQELKLKDEQEEMFRNTKKWHEIESNNATLQNRLESLQQKYDQEVHKLAIATKQLQQLQKQLDEDTQQISRSSLEVKYIQLKKDYNKLQQELEEAKEVSQRESQKRDEILIAKVKLEKTLQQTRKKLDRLKERSLFTPSMSRPEQRATNDHGLSPNRSAKANNVHVRVDPALLKNMSKEDMQSYMSEMLVKLEEEALAIIQLEQDNQHLQLRLTTQIENESKKVHQLQDSIRALEIELEKANSVIHFQHQEFTAKVKELEDTRQRLLSSFMKSSAPSAASPQPGTTKPTSSATNSKQSSPVTGASSKLESPQGTTKRVPQRPRDITT